MRAYTRSMKMDATVKAMKKPLPQWIIRALIYSGIAAILIMFASVLRTISDTESTKGSYPDIGSDVKIKTFPAKIEIIEIMKPGNGVKVTSPIIGVEGKAHSCSVVGLYLNAELVSTTMPNIPLFYFKEVKLTRKENIIQAKCFSDEGSSFSNAIIVYYIIPQGTERTNSFMQSSVDNLLRGNRDRREIALTFDGGSMANVAETILEILRKHSIKATFFITGIFIEKYPDIVKEINRDGHEIGNHTYSHPHLTSYFTTHQQITLKGVTRELVIEELKKTDNLFYEVIGRRMNPYWRAPYGENNTEIRQWASELGYTHIGWTSGRDETLDSLDWVSDAEMPKYKTSKQIAAQILSFGYGTSNEANGGIILMHLGTERKDDSITQSLSSIIEGYMQRGYRFVTVGYMNRHKDDLIIADYQEKK
ncbi:MAG: hypothetical protein A2Y62_16420 [Candidatus Fischerbacteria bacterium RBG_13_37_8]|uniref:NodB homology domain-containing protein n=1 Tax=Candidatus Fischerbacteria bacterium RBG_13_37_8 TaxID=1817863 RepID=A0A1F5VWP0_9BACT|nr:MAG: hypothetical protein A2Y62_16420 [Candidatus Fischerbacteria bacterium RBG_13_37_8]